MSMNLIMSEIVPEPVLDKLWMGAFLSSYHPNGDQRFKLLNYGRAVVAETIARIPSGWKTGEPDVPKGKEREFNVAVRRAHSPDKVFVFSATYANHYEDEMRDRDGNDFVAHGWYHCGLDSSGEFDTVYEKVLGEGDEVVGWQPLPQWSDEA